MGKTYNLVLNANFDADISDDQFQALKYLSLPDYELNEPLKLVYPEWGDMWRYLNDNAGLLAHNPTNGIISVFQEHAYWPKHWELKYVANNLRDDDFYENELPIACWLASFAMPGLVGYWNEVNYLKGTVELIYGLGGSQRNVSVSAPQV